MMAEIFEKTRIENLKIKKENRSYYLSSKYTKSLKGICVYNILIGGKIYICRHRGSLKTSLIYHLERSLRDYMQTEKVNMNSFHTYIAKNGLYKLENFFKAGGDIKCEEENTIKERENEIIREAREECGTNYVWNINN